MFSQHPEQVSGVCHKRQAGNADEHEYPVQRARDDLRVDLAHASVGFAHFREQGRTMPQRFDLGGRLDLGQRFLRTQETNLDSDILRAAHRCKIPCTNYPSAFRK